MTLKGLSYCSLNTLGIKTIESINAYKDYETLT